MTGIEPNQHQTPGSAPDGLVPQEAQARGRFAMQVLWPSFLIAVPCVGIIFSAATAGARTPTSGQANLERSMAGEIDHRVDRQARSA
ncbi:MAG: hypothetical protein K0B16_00755 [Burkholderiaceae bacterium]|nr:hypothetical protein [Burkholderiaceae bacterium]